ncbi:MAG: hypothetical protein FXF54_10820 [Kosmotoga sp.]|nr:MAG: hypothetical protein FXF54_10820 [Kosmotoga sp.]
MELKKLTEVLNCKILNYSEEFEDVVIESVGAADMMSDVLAFGQQNMLLVTGLNTPQSVRTASLIGAAAVMIVRKKDIPEKTIALANELGIPLIYSKISLYKACGELYKLKLKDVLEEE